MQADGHVGLNLLLASPATCWFLAGDQPLVFGAVTVGVLATAPLPDVDLGLPLDHRGPTHTVWFAAVAGCAYAAVLVAAGPGRLPGGRLAVVGFASGFGGVIGHLLGDVVTPMGVAPFEPVSGYWKSFGWTTSADRRANRRLLGAGAAAATLAVAVGAVL